MLFDTVHNKTNVCKLTVLYYTETLKHKQIPSLWPALDIITLFIYTILLNMSFPSLQQQENSTESK